MRLGAWFGILPDRHLPHSPVGTAAGCDLLIFGIFKTAENQKIAAFGSSYKERAMRCSPNG
jgi:hypothetical protein